MHRAVFDLHSSSRCFEGCDPNARVLVDLKKPVDNDALAKAVEFMYTLELQVEIGKDVDPKSPNDVIKLNGEAIDELFHQLKALLAVAEVFVLEPMKRACYEFIAAEFVRPETALALWKFLTTTSIKPERVDDVIRQLARQTLDLLQRGMPIMIMDEKFLRMSQSTVANLLRDVVSDDDDGAGESSGRFRGEADARGMETLVVDAVVNWVNFRYSQRRNCVDALLKEAGLKTRDGSLKAAIRRKLK